MKKQLIFSSFIFMVLTFIACTKGEQGDIGPVGLAGVNGAKGVAGDKGIADAKGMFSSEWIEIKGADWRPSVAVNSYFATYTSSILTADIVNKGVLYAFYKAESDANQIWALPFFSASSGQKFNALIALIANVPAIQFNQNVTPPTSTFSASKNYSFRFVVVPASGARMSGIDWNNYEEVKKFLNWKD